MNSKDSDKKVSYAVPGFAILGLFVTGILGWFEFSGFGLLASSVSFGLILYFVYK